MKQRKLLPELKKPDEGLPAESQDINVVKMQLRDDYQTLELDTKSGMENYTHGYVGKSRTVSSGGTQGVSASLTAALTEGDNTFRASGRVGADAGYNRSLNTSTTLPQPC